MNGDKDFWRAVYLAAIQLGQPEWVARQAADSAIANSPSA